VTSEEWAEFDRSIAASVARQEAAVARQEAAIAEQEKARARFDAAMAEWADLARLVERQMAALAAERREEKDERRTVLEGLSRMIDRLPPPQTAS
jgi:hypothetical protein